MIYSSTSFYDFSLQGTTIQVVIFNDAVEKFKELFMKDQTYFIENSVVKGVNERFLNVHKEIELSLNVHTKVNHAKTEVTLKNLKYDFIPFEEAIKQGDGKKTFSTYS